MNRAVISALAAMGLSLLLAGCPPAYPKCNSDEQCKEHGEVCVQGQCQECAGDVGCKEGFICQENKCVPKPPSECKADADCGAGKKCQAGRCEVAERPQGTCTTSADCGAGEECQAGTCISAKAACDFEPLHFAFDDYSLNEEARSKLSSLADCLKKEPGKVVLAGHADERGTEEYNLQLSNKRAASVKKYLVDLGLKPSRLETVGFGANRPVSSGHDEAAWAENRRVEFKR